MLYHRFVLLESIESLFAFRRLRVLFRLKDSLQLLEPRYVYPVEGLAAAAQVFDLLIHFLTAFLLLGVLCIDSYRSISLILHVVDKVPAHHLFRTLFPANVLLEALVILVKLRWTEALGHV